jgi:hypothetical protein
MRIGRKRQRIVGHLIFTARAVTKTKFADTQDVIRSR